MSTGTRPLAAWLDELTPEARAQIARPHYGQRDVTSADVAELLAELRSRNTFRPELFRPAGG